MFKLACKSYRKTANCLATARFLATTDIHPKDAKSASPAPPPQTSGRPVRQEPSPVRLGFIPENFLEFFYKKTGVSGFGTFCFTVGTFLVSKELYILEHEYYNGLSVALMCILGVKYVGPDISKMLDKEIDAYEHSMVKGRIDEADSYTDGIKHEHVEQKVAEGQLLLVEAKRENVHLQREAEYRQRLMKAYKETRNRLDYYLVREDIERAIAQRQIIYWVGEHVKQSITPDLQAQVLAKCFEDLQNLAKIYDTMGTPYPTPDK